jgi:hypothetical protein
VFAALAVAVSPVIAIAAQCTAVSAPQRVALLELYTSEGCNSCPPTDRWVSGLPSRGLAPSRVVALAFHVDYWNYLGWRDPFAKAQYSERQTTASARRGARVVYTPQLLLNGRDYRRDSFFDGFGERLAAISREPAQAKINIQLHAGDNHALRVSGSVLVPKADALRRAQTFLAIYENDLASQVTAGENKGKRLRHDFVVRELAGPFPVSSAAEGYFNQLFRLDPAWKTGDLHVAAFVQDEQTGDVLQSLALAHCR